MRIFYKLEDIPADFGPTIVSVGNFDGVHRAHQDVLCKVVERARATGSKALAVTFNPHPVRIIRPDAAPKLITPLPQKLELLKATGIDATLVIPFTRDFSMSSPREFAQHILRWGLRAKEVHEGANFRFGHRARGNVSGLAAFGREFGFELKVYPEMKVRGDLVSSSRIRERIRSGDVSRARVLLGRLFSIVNTPAPGRGYGEKFTVPTINLARYDELVPGDGVYITQTRIHNECFDSVTNIGVRPTFGAESFAIETYLLNFHPIELTGKTPIETFFLRRLRDEIKFPSVEALRHQIAIDVKRARKYFSLMKDSASMQA